MDSYAGEVYPHAPVVLVALEVRYPDANPLTPAQADVMKARLSDHVPIMKRDQQTTVTAVAAVPAGGNVSPPEVRTDPVTRFLSRDQATVVSVQRSALVVETAAYHGWDRLRRLIKEALVARQDAGGIDAVERIGLRYVNEIRPPEEWDRSWCPWVDSSLMGPAALGDELDLEPKEWQGITAFSRDGGRAMVLRYGARREGFAVDPYATLRRPQPVATPGPYFLLDIDSFWTAPGELPEFDAKTQMPICDDLHEPVRAMFERLITPELREVLRNG